MKKTLLNSIPNEIPRDIQRFVSVANIYDSSCSPEANVYFIDKGNGYYLKCSGKGMLEKESKMTEYFHSKGLGAEVLHYISDDRDWLLTSAVIGEDCLHERYLADPKRLCDTMAYELRKLHETDYTGCLCKVRFCFTATIVCLILFLTTGGYPGSLILAMAALVIGI